jgi:NTE family protein
MSSDNARRLDLVLEGGGVKGIGLVGALSVLEEHRYEPYRVAGTSAGAIVGALIAAGIPAAKLAELIFSLDYTQVPDTDAYNAVPGAGEVIALALRDGIHPGSYGEHWVADHLAAVGVKTFGDLRIAGDDARMEERYRLVVVVSDVSSGRLVHFPWDYARYGLDPDAQSVAVAVHASSAIPFFFRPVVLRGTDGGVSTLVDGGLLSNFPLGAFDRPDGPPRWPTFGIKLSAKPDANQVPHAVRGPIGLLKAVISTGLNAHDQMHLDDPDVVARTIFVDTQRVSQVDFDITERQQHELFGNGRTAAEKFLPWSFDDYVRAFRSGAVLQEG